MSSVWATVFTDSGVVCIIRIVQELLRWKLPVILFLFVQTLKALNWNYNPKCRGLIKRTFLDLYSSKLRIFCLAKHRTTSQPMEGPHTNVGTWAPSYLATLLMEPDCGVVWLNYEEPGSATMLMCSSVRVFLWYLLSTPRTCVKV